MYKEDSVYMLAERRAAERRAEERRREVDRERQEIRGQHERHSCHSAKPSHGVCVWRMA